MKTLIKKLKLGVLLAGLVILTSCGKDITGLSSAGMNAMVRTVPSLAISATKYTGIKFSKYLKSSTATKISNQTLIKKVEKTNRSQKALPISIGIAGEARLVSSTNR